MKHLHESEFVDYAEGALPAARAAHLETCSECRAQADGIGAMLREAPSVDVPEPSPLFWEHFSSHVRERLADEAPGGRTSWALVTVRALIPLAAAIAVVIAVFSAVLLPRLARTPVTSGSLAASHTTPEVNPAIERDPNVDAQNAEVWEVLTAAASDMGLDEAHAAGLTAHPAAVDRAVQRLNPDELKELGRLLQTELKRASN